MNDLDRRMFRPQDGVSLHYQLSSLFRRRITSGEWPVGAQIPTLEVLTKEFGAAPATVRKALSGLAADGLIARYPARGTFVLARPAESLWHEIGLDGDGFLIARDGPEVRLLSRDYVDEPPLSPHEGRFTGAYVHLRRCYWRAGAPFLVNDLYLDRALYDHVPEAILAGRPVAEIIRQAATPPRARLLQTLTISGADPQIAETLDIALNAPVARIDRTRIDQHGAVITISCGHYRGDVVRLDFRESH